MTRYSHGGILGLLLAVLLMVVPAAADTTVTPAPLARSASAASRNLTPPQEIPPNLSSLQGTGRGGDRVETAPRLEAASKPTLVYGDRVLAEDTVWRGEVLVQGVLAVAPQATLSIEPGTVVRFRRTGVQAPLLVVQGRIVAVGTREAPVIFTSSFAQPAAGDWQGILILGSEKKNQMENCRIEGAETGIDVLFSSVTLKGVWAEQGGTGIRFQDALVVMDGGGASGCRTALSFTESEATLRNLSLTGNRQGVIALRSSIYLLEGNLSGNKEAAFSGDTCRVKIQGGALLGNGSGATLLGCEGSVTGAKLVQNREFGLSLASSRVKVAGNLISGNGKNGMIVADGAAVAWNNAIFENAGYDLYHSGVEEFRAPANWWGGAHPKVFDNGGRGHVLYAPVLGSRPFQPLAP